MLTFCDHSGCIASVIRMYYFFEINALSDNTWVSVQLMSWACAEPGIIFVCACLPALWPAIRKSLSLRTRHSKNTGSDEVQWKQSEGRGPQIWSEHGQSRSIFRGNHDFITLGDMAPDQKQRGLHSAMPKSHTHSMAVAEGSGILVHHETTQVSDTDGSWHDGQDKFFPGV